MKLQDAVAYSIGHMRRRQIRAYLTILGIILGIATIVVLVSVGEGVKKDINSQLDVFGSDLITVMPYNLDDVSSMSATSMTSSGKLIERDIDYINRVPGIEDIGKAVYGRVGVQFRDKEISSPVYAMTPNVFEMFAGQYEVEDGRFIQEGETGSVFLMNDAAYELFGKDKVGVGNEMYIGGKKYRVVGIAKKIGASMSQQDDAAIYVPYDDRDELFGNTIAKDEISMILVKVQKGVDPEEAALRIEEQIASSHRVSLDDKDFSVMTAKTIQETVDQITGILTGALFLIGLISAIVGGIGIANAMFMSVLERTNEIGVLKSIGASSRDILLLFIAEAGLIGGAGGIVGLALGWFVTLFIPYFGVIPYLSAELAVGVVLFAVGVGVISGSIPAYNASRIPAIEALRYD
jgi:putative ABC transport system permease protein